MNDFQDISNIRRNTEAILFIKRICTLHPDQQSLVYFSSKDSAIDMARAFALNMPIKNDPELEKLSREIKSEIHDTYYLAELIRRGIAYHIGYLPSYIRNAIEKCYREKKISIISVAVDAPQDTISALAGKIGRLSGVSVKTAYSAVISEE